MSGLLGHPDGSPTNRDTNGELTHSLRGPDKQFRAFGMKALKPNHPEVVSMLDAGHCPTQFGSRIWPSSYLLISYLSHLTLSDDLHVMELGCGWGLPAAYVRKRFGSKVTAADSDKQVFAFQQYISEINNVNVIGKHCSYADLCGQDLASVDLMIGADICYSSTISKDLEQLFERFALQGGKEVILTDRGRVPFTRLVERLASCYANSLTDVELSLPTSVKGHVFHIRM